MQKFPNKIGLQLRQVHLNEAQAQSTLNPIPTQLNSKLEATRFEPNPIIRLLERNWSVSPNRERNALIFSKTLVIHKPKWFNRKFSLWKKLQPWDAMIHILTNLQGAPYKKVHIRDYERLYIQDIWYQSFPDKKVFTDTEWTPSLPIWKKINLVRVCWG